MPLFFVYFFFLHYIHSYYHSFITFAEGPSSYLHSCRLSGRNLHGVPSRDSNSGLPYSKSAHYLVTHRYLLSHPPASTYVVTHRRLSLINLFSWPTISPLSHTSFYLPTHLCIRTLTPSYPSLIKTFIYHSFFLPQAKKS